MYESRAKRFSSFTNENRNTPHCSFADAGFYHSGCKDKVVCYFCGGQLFNWWTHDPWLEHAKWFSYCPFIQNAKGKIFIESAVKLRKDVILHNTSKVIELINKLKGNVPSVVYLSLDHIDG
jgi:baculoviral IAP repeat-containing protein 7/8